MRCGTIALVLAGGMAAAGGAEELAYLNKGAPLGLHGRLEITVPRIGLPARVDLLSLDGPVSPAAAPAGKAPAEFIGRPHHFARSFYKGEAMQLAVAYKEPVTVKQRDLP
ncbi:MAG: hypothetical protein ABIF71_09960 [Planctomycetota bacterium]